MQSTLTDVGPTTALTHRLTAERNARTTGRDGNRSGGNNKGWPMFFFYFNKLGWLGSILVSVALTVVLVLAFRMLGS